jgi:hypothetical protein
MESQKRIMPLPTHGDEDHKSTIHQRGRGLPLQAEMPDHPKTEGQAAMPGPYFPICFTTPELFAILP